MSRAAFKLEGVGGLPGIKLAQGWQVGYSGTINGNLTVTGTLSAGAESVTAQTITSASANAFAVGANGTTNPVFNVDASASTIANGLNIQGFAAGTGPILSVISSGTNEDLNINPKGAGFLRIFNAVSAGGVIVLTTSGQALQVGRTNSNPAFNVDASTGSSATGINFKAAAATAGLAVTTTSSGTNENLTIAAKGAGTITFNPATVATAGGAVGDGIQYGSIGVGLYTGTGTPTFSAMNGSIYTDSNATTTTTRIYVNKSGAGTAGTTWTALTTAA